ncbi:MAG: hypothetical protein Q8R00_00900 [Candidatus Nanoarchaeia archaeon]|nr:hypothetical protein [Candidatus Nanoarchaeia archaeon]
MTFPKDPCYICKNPIDTLSLGYVIGHNFAEELVYLSKNKSLEEIVSGKDSLFVNAITMEYFNQFRDFFTPDEDSIDFRDYIAEREVNFRAHKARLSRVISVVENNDDPNELHLFILAHSECAPEQGYSINLDRIDSPQKAIEWTLHLGEKTWFNFDGWYRILGSLFGRTSA